MSLNQITEEVILNMLHIVLIEIRAREDQNYSRIMSDIFHNVPNGLARKKAPDKIFESMKLIAKRHEVESYLDKLLEHSLKKT